MRVQVVFHVMNRRLFLSSLVATTAGLFVRNKTIFLPPVGGWGLPHHVSIADINEILEEYFSSSVADQLNNEIRTLKWLQHPG